MINLGGIKIDTKLLVIDNTKNNVAYSVNFKENQSPICIESGKLPDDRIANADIETVDAISFKGCCIEMISKNLKNAAVLGIYNATGGERRIGVYQGKFFVNGKLQDTIYANSLEGFVNKIVFLYPQYVSDISDNVRVDAMERLLDAYSESVVVFVDKIRLAADLAVDEFAVPTVRMRDGKDRCVHPIYIKGMYSSILYKLYKEGKIPHIDITAEEVCDAGEVFEGYSISAVNLHGIRKNGKRHDGSGKEFLCYNAGEIAGTIRFICKNFLPDEG